MTAREVLKTALKGTKDHLNMLLGDFTDAELLVRPVPGANHAAWQIGNIIVGDIYMIQSEFPNLAYPKLPDGFMELHGPEGAKNDGPAGFLTKAEYLKLFGEARDATISALDKISDADLDRPSSEKVRSWAPTLCHVFLMASDHTLMHTGQFSVIRRKLGKPVLF